MPTNKVKDINDGLKMVNHPDHYTKGIECLEYINSWDMDYLEGNIIKYVTRYKYKNGLEDLQKAQFYLNYLICKQTP